MATGPRTDNQIAVIVPLEDASHIIVSILGAVLLRNIWAWLSNDIDNYGM